MKVEIIGKNIEVTEGITVAINESLHPVEKYFVNKDLKAKVIVRTYPIGQKVEMSLTIDPSHTIRQEVTHEDLYAAIDLAGKKLESQIRRFKDRIATNKKKSEHLNAFFNVNEFESEKITKKITRRKTLDNKPMTEEEALLQFELTSHDFFVFDDYEQDMIKILYKRKDGEYGVIELES